MDGGHEFLPERGIDEQRKGTQVLSMRVEHEFRVPLHAEDVMAIPHDDRLD